MILVAGATGNVGSALVRQLIGPPQRTGTGAAVRVRALTRDPARASFPAGVEVVTGDLTHPESLRPALEGVRALFLPSGTGEEEAVFAAARRAGAAHVVLVSSITVLTHPHLPAARENLAVERQLQDSGLAWTVLRPTQFASNALWWAEAIRGREPVRAPYADVGLPAVHPADVAAVARTALTEPGHRGRAYALTGPARVTARRQVAAIAAAIGRDVPFVEISRAEARARLAPFLGAETADAVLDLTGGDVNDALLRVRDTVQRITGAPARSFEQWATENAAAFR
ncbi:NAD(P)H-binding protein [Streptomyces sp. NPDC017979]|uniref:NAD(P)H-binding protein n=1 Tax=Streptomyces sp. NPDC017979 TaxID=3365024 RepID=UPI0037A9DEF5